MKLHSLFDEYFTLLKFTTYFLKHPVYARLKGQSKEGKNSEKRALRAALHGRASEKKLVRWLKRKNSMEVGQEPRLERMDIES